MSYIIKEYAAYSVFLSLPAMEVKRGISLLAAKPWQIITNGILLLFFIEDLYITAFNFPPYPCISIFFVVCAKPMLKILINNKVRIKILFLL